MIVTANDISKNNANSRRYAERRNKPDWVVKSVSVIAVLGWIGAIAALAYYSIAMPSRGYNLPEAVAGHAAPATYLNVGALNAAFISILVSFFICLIGLLVNMTRHRRKTDRFNKSVIILGGISFVLIVAFIFAFYI
ncbi:MAG: hypothetical protein FWG32_08965 [Oscillospiraceae bacterium]|nr:hypothetical protein [Oscillospiraceae bacterium]